MSFLLKVTSKYKVLAVDSRLNNFLDEAKQQFRTILKKNGLDAFLPVIKVKEDPKKRNWLALYRSGSALKFSGPSNPIIWVNPDFIKICDKQNILDPTKPLLDTLLHEMWHGMADVIRLRSRYAYENTVPDETDQGRGEEDAAELAIELLCRDTFKSSPMGKAFFEALEWYANGLLDKRSS
jgi:hypothetical protein